jgi:hypothetical protein
MIKLLLGISNQQVPLNHHEIGEIPFFPKITIELPLNCRKNYHFSPKKKWHFPPGHVSSATSAASRNLSEFT